MQISGTKKPKKNKFWILAKIFVIVQFTMLKTYLPIGTFAIGAYDKKPKTIVGTGPLTRQSKVKIALELSQCFLCRYVEEKY